ncbi:MAG: hypothetical protein NTV23_02650 [Propionibacteriales bacterium]|nr:hypothetical protein [Propionibacteriales bacterium]
MRQADTAGRKAHEVVGLYGDPDTTWGICLELGLDEQIDVAGASRRVADLVAAHPHLGPAPEVVSVVSAGWARARAGAAAAPYSEGSPLIRVLVDDEGHVLVAAHHGACDGLGLVAVAQAVVGVPLTTRARGIGDRSAPRSFLRGSVLRLLEAILRPPPRFVPHTVAPTQGEHLRVRTGPRLRAGSADLAMAVTAVFASWNPAAHGAASRPLLIAGASRRAQGTLAPDRQTGYLRFRSDPAWDREQVRTSFASTAPEPEFPETSAGGIGPRVTRLLRSRLGGTAQLSNLGVVEGPGLVYAAMFPALSGPRAVAVGMVSTASSTSLSLRTRGSEFSAADSDALLDRISAALTEAQ